MIKRILFIFLVNVVIFKFSQAQTKDIDGYIITLKNDSIYGKIINNTYYTNSLICEFKAINTDSFKRFLPNNILVYRFAEGKYYVSKAVDNKYILT